MKIKVDEDVFDVTVQLDGSWKFFWEDEFGKNYHIYQKEQVHKFLVEQKVWEIIPEVKQELAPHYAAAFNMWMDDYMNNPQAYEDSQTIAIRHLTEKLNGEEPSYGAVCAEVLVKYLNKLESK